jgi:K+-sensing histidine kinase KdpD
VRQICVNLLSNASKYTAAGKISFSVQLEPMEPEQPDMWAVEVRDTGIGIPIHQRQLIFERFATLQVIHILGLIHACYCIYDASLYVPICSVVHGLGASF